MGVTSVWRKVRWSLAQRGVVGTGKMALHALGRLLARRNGGNVAHPFDALHGTETGGLISGGSLAVGSRHDAHITAYAGIAPSRLRAALDMWRERLPAGEQLEAFSFVDLGCGKGRAMLLASERPFREVLGVELNAALAGTARENVLLFERSGLRRAGITVIGGDAAAVAYPPGPLLVFIYNSFGVPVVRLVLDALERHVRRTRSRVDLLFQNEGPEMPLRNDVRLQMLWTGTLALSAEDAAADPVASSKDVTSLYRWIGNESEGAGLE